MTSVPVPDEAATHLGAILLAFNREIFGGFLDEADELAALGQVTSAVLIAGTVLEYVERSPAAGSLLIGTRSEIEQLGNELLEPLFPVTKGIRLLGISLSSLVAEEAELDREFSLPL